MEATQKRKQDIIKNIAIVFLTVLLLLTFFSSTILNYSLPEVAAQYAYGGQITSSVRVTGTAEANENYPVILEEGRTVHSVAVRRGDTVAAGDILVLLEDGASTELETAVNTLTEAKRSYEKWKLTAENDIEDQTKQIAYAEEDLKKTKAKGYADIDTQAEEAAVKAVKKELAVYTLAAAQMTYDNAKAALDKAQAENDAAENDAEAKQNAIDDANDALVGLQEKQAEAEAVLAEKEAALTAAEQTLEALEQQVEENANSETLKSAKRNLRDKQIAYDRAYAAYEADVTAYEKCLGNRTSLKKAYDSAVADYNADAGELNNTIAYYDGILSYLTGLSELTPAQETEMQDAIAKRADASSALAELTDAVTETKAAYEENEANITQMASALSGTQMQIEDMKRELDDTIEDYNALVDTLSPEKLKEKVAEAQTEVKNRTTVRDAAKLAANEAKAAVDAAEDAIKAAEKELKTLNKKLTAAGNALAEADGTYQTAKASLDAAKQEAKADGKAYTAAQLERLTEDAENRLADAEEKLRQKQDEVGGGLPSKESYEETVTSAQRNIETLRTALERTKENNALEEVTYTEAIADAQEEVDRIRENAGASVVTAKVGGTVGSIYVSAGQKTDPQTTLMEIMQTDRGFTATVSLTTAQAKRISVGQTANILYWWGDTPEAVVASVKPDPSDPQNTRIVTINLNGDIVAGQSFTFSLGEKSQSYDTVVPNTAIREDSNGKFVLVVNAKTTPVGNRYTAARMDIEVIASDETSSAVSGLAGGEFVITTASEPIAAGQQVRLSEA